MKFVALIVEEDDFLHNENPSVAAAPTKDEPCHYCTKAVRGVEREAVTIYDVSQEPPQKCLVSVHHRCEEERQIKLARMFPC